MRTKTFPLFSVLVAISLFLVLVACGAENSVPCSPSVVEESDSGYVKVKMYENGGYKTLTPGEDLLCGGVTYPYSQFAGQIASEEGVETKLSETDISNSEKQPKENTNQETSEENIPQEVLPSASVPEQHVNNVQEWVNLFASPNSQPPEYTETLPEWINNWLAEKCPYPTEMSESNGEKYAVCKDYEGETIEIQASDLLAMGTLVTPWPDELVAVKYAWDAARTVRVLKAVILIAGAADAGYQIAYFARHSGNHDPRFFPEVAEKIEEASWRVNTWLKDPNNKGVPYLLCAIVLYKNGGQQFRLFDVATGWTFFFVPEGWTAGFEGKSPTAFLSADPPGTSAYLAYDPTTGKQSLEACRSILFQAPPAGVFK